MTSRTRTQHRWLAAAVVCVVAVALAGALPARAKQMSNPSLRSLSGRVSDTSHEPIRGAIVELRNSNTLEVVTYLTDDNGRYNFKRLDGNVDYEVWVIFRGKPSATRSISKFDSHMVKVINFTVRAY
ncbi:MAG: carboxypeptidase regulatory-like domain-containing protein [Burkholderiales bacterium]|nr:carboxypeptidase regulatory-like domain-containing protein [Burkholderiales bacterium]